MKWTLLLFVGIIVVLVFTLRASPRLSPAAAREHLRNGALLVDVRTVTEFHARHLTNALNIPLNELTVQLPVRVPDKTQVILLHCQSGRRSEIAEQRLRSLGYANAFNIGSYAQAEKIVNDAGP